MEWFVKEDSAFFPFQEGKGRRKLKASFLDMLSTCHSLLSHLHENL